MLRECLLSIAHAYALWALTEDTMPHLHRQCAAQFYAAMQGRDRHVD